MRPVPVNQRVARRVVRRPAVVAPVLRRAVRLHAVAAQLVARHTRAAARVSAAELLLARSAIAFATNVSQLYLLHLPVLERRSHERTQIAGSLTPTLERVMHVNSRPPDTVTVARIGASGALRRDLTLRHVVVERVRREQSASERRSEIPSGRSDADLRPAAPATALSVAHAGRHLAQLPLARPVPIPVPAAPGTSAAGDTLGTRPTPAGTNRGGAISERDIDRLTERVIGSIDRRLIAQRERVGRP